MDVARLPYKDDKAIQVTFVERAAEVAAEVVVEVAYCGGGRGCF